MAGYAYCMPQFDVISIGSAVLDVLLKSSSFSVTAVHEQLMMCEIYGGKMDVEEALMVSGGAATNTAVSFMRQGLRTACMAKIGMDVPAQVIWDDLGKEHVDIAHMIQDPSVKTGISAVLVASDGARSALTFRGGAHSLTSQEIHWHVLEQTRAIHLSSVGSTALIRELITFAKDHHIFLSWNPSKAEAEELLLQSHDELLLPDLICMNDLEWEAIRPVQEKVISLCKRLIITKGKEGGEMYLDGVKSTYAPGKPSAVVDETGAGDAFVAGVTGAHLRGLAFEDAVAFGVENATGVVEHMGAKEGLKLVSDAH